MKAARRCLILFVLVLLVCGTLGVSSAGAATKAEIDASIVNGVAYLAALQSTGGAPAGAYPCDSYYAANTGFVTAVLEHFAEHQGKNPLDPTFAYHENVQAGLDYLFASAVYDETNHWVYWNDNGINTYQTGPCLMAIARSGAPDAVVSGGALDGFTYKQVAQMVVDWLGSAQETNGTATGAWYYYKGAGAGDQSATGWVGMGLGYAVHSMACTLPDGLLDRLSIWNDYIQSHVDDATFGGAGYVSDWPGWINTYKTGHLIFNQALCGDTLSTQRVQDALTFMANHWDDPTNGYMSEGDYGWRGDPANDLAPSYIAMAASMKGFTAFDIETFRGIDWYQDFSDVAVANQYADGHWVGGGYDEEEAPLRSTCWALMTLLKVSTYVPPQVATEEATAVTTSTAILNGQLASLGTSETVDVSFEYGTTSGVYSDETPAVEKAISPAAFSATLGGLTPGVTYFFRAKAAGEATAYGEELSFTTPIHVDPPTTVVKGVPGKWVRRAVTLRFVASPAPDGAPVDYTEYRVGGGAWKHGTKVTVRRQGATTVAYRSVDTLGNVEVTKTCKVRIDTVPPVVYDYGRPVVWRGGVLRCRYKVVDATSRTVRTVLAVTRYHKPVKQYPLGMRRTGKRLVAVVRSHLGVGTWSWRVVAFDRAGNRAVGRWHYLDVYPR